MILSSETAIEDNENAGQLHDRLMVLGGETILNTLKLIETKKTVPQIQSDMGNIKTAHKLDKENCKIDWNKSANEIYNTIRGLSPYPGAWFILKDKDQEWQIKIFEAIVNLENHSEKIGEVFINKKEIKIAVLGGFIEILTLQFPGKKKMSTAELLNGLKFSEEVSVY